MARIAATERRSALVQAALTVIARDGLAAATTRTIVAEAGMSLASFHYVFASRDELISECIAFVVEHEILAAEQGISATDLREAVEEGLRAYLELVIANPLREQAMFELTQYAMRTPGLEPAAKIQYDAYYQAAAGIISAVAEQTGVSWNRPLDEMARILITLTDGLTLGWLVDRDTRASERVIEFAADALTAMATPTRLKGER